MNQAIGLAGAGKMGNAIARRLLEHGCDVTVWNRTRQKAEALTAFGARVVASPGELLVHTQTVISIVTDDAALDAVYRGADGLAASARPGSLFIEMSTVQPAAQIRLAADMQAIGASFLECPVGGTTGPAREGKLLGLAGGDADAFERARPLLNLLCRRLEHVGNIGAGAAMKLAINLPLIVYWQALGEALALTRDLHIPARYLVDILADTSGAPAALRNRIEAVALALDGASTPGSYDIDAMRKDLRTALFTAEAVNIQLPLATQALGCLDASAANGQGGSDGIAQSVYWRDRGTKEGAERAVVYAGTPSQGGNTPTT